MKSRIVLSTLLIFQFSSGFTIAAIFQISRTKPQGYLGWENGIDDFGMTPASMCGQNSEYECGVFKASDVVPNCNCSCPVEKSTFAAFENQWTCIENTEVRTNLQSRQYSEPGEKGCGPDMGILFVNEYSNSSLRVFNVGDEKAISLRNNWGSCKVDRNLSWYYECSDSRLSSRHLLDTMENLFTLTKRDHYYNIKVGNNVLNTHLLTGLIINLGIHCRNATYTRRGCLLFKLEGSITCPITKAGLPVTSTRKPYVFSKAREQQQQTASLIPTISTSLNLKTNSKPVHPSFSVPIAPSTTSVSPPAIATVAQRNVSSHVPSSSPNPDDSKQSTSGKSFAPIWLVPGVTASVLFILLILAGFFIIRRNNSRKNAHAVIVTRSPDRQVSSVVINPHVNSAFQEDEENGYSTLNLRESAVYASMYQMPMVDRRTSFNEMSNPLQQDPNTGHVHDSLTNVPQRHGIYGGARRTSVLPTVPNEMVRFPDNATRFQNYGHLSIEQLVYNIVEEILTGGYERPANGNNVAPKETDPVYNVLEEPYCETSEKPHQYDDVPKDDVTTGAVTNNDVTNDATHTDVTNDVVNHNDVTIDDVTPDEPVYSILEDLNMNTNVSD